VAPDEDDEKEDEEGGDVDEEGAENAEKAADEGTSGGGDKVNTTAENAGKEAKMSKPGTAENGEEGKSDEVKDVEKGEGDDPDGDDDEASVPPPPTALQRMMAAATRLIAGSKAGQEDQALPGPLEAYRALERKREAAARAKWFDENVHNTIFARDELRLEGPNRHLSDFSDATVLPPGMKPFPTEGPPVSACGSEFYDLKAANLDSVED